MSELLTSALAYAAAGWPVFPCRPGEKVPAWPSIHRDRADCRGECGRLGHGFYDATTDPDLIARMWQPQPHANVAVATGAPGPDVLDVDTKDGRAGMDLFERARRAGLLRGAAALVRTPSGGLHVWFAGTDQPGGAVGGKDKPLELKAVGGYVLLPPSYVDDRERGYAGRYELIERRETAGTIDFGAIRRLLDPPRPPPSTRPGHGRDLAALARWVAQQGAGNRNAGLYWAACRAASSGHRDLDALVRAGVQAGLSEAEAARTVRSALRRIGGDT